jgi:hypothetical protein
VYIRPVGEREREREMCGWLMRACQHVGQAHDATSEHHLSRASSIMNQILLVYIDKQALPCSALSQASRL